MSRKLAGTLAAAAFLVGLAADHLFLLHWDNSVHFGDVSNLFVSIVIFGAIQLLWTRESSQRESETEVLISLAREILKRAANLDAAIARSCNPGPINPLPPENIQELNNAHTALQNEIYNLSVCLDHCNIPKQQIGFTEIEEIREGYRNLFDTPYPVSLPDTINREHGACYRRMREQISLFMLKLVRR